MKTVRSSSRTCSARFVPGQNQLLANLSLLLFLRIFRSFVFMILKRTFEECVSLFSYQCSLLSQTALIFYHVVLTLSRTFLTFFETCYFSTLFAFNSHIISSFIWLVKNFFHLFYLFEKFLYLSDNLILFLHFAHIIVCLSQTQLDYDIIIHQYLSTLFLFYNIY